MRGSLVKRSKNSWSIILDQGRDPATGKRRQQWVSVKGNKRDAERKLAELVHQVDTGVYVKASKSTVREYIEQWLRDYAQVHVRPRTFESYRERANQILAQLGNIPLGELKASHIQGYYAKKLESLSASTLIKHHNLIHQALAHAVKLGILARNVSEVVDPPKPVRKEMRALDYAEVQSLLDTCSETPWYPMIHTLIWTGLRRSELLGLRWKDIDLVLANLRIVQVLHQLSSGDFVLQEPKTAKGRRAVALSPVSCVLLRELRKKQEANAGLLGVPVTGDSLVFGHLDGSPRAPATLTHAFSKLSKRAGFSGVRLHDLRHTHASLLFQQGIHPKVVSERLGHANILITLDTYSHLLPGMQEAAAMKFDLGMEIALAETER